jgi:hypothetical protein
MITESLMADSMHNVGRILLLSRYMIMKNTVLHNPLVFCGIRDSFAIS